MSKQDNRKSISQDENSPLVGKLSDIEQDLITLNPQIFQGINPKKKEEILRSISFTLIQERTHSGPLPDADTLISYNSVIPDGADRIMRMAENQQQHRMAIEKIAISSQSRQSIVGQWFGLIIGIFGIGCGTFLAYSGATTVGGIIAGGTVISLVSVFVIGKRIQK